MTIYSLQVVGLGEVLWDCLPGGKQLGGAPSNFAYMADLLGDRGIVASRVGEDELGGELRETMSQLHLTTDGLQTDRQHPTSTVQVTVDQTGQPEYVIVEDVAWDFMEWTPAWEELAHQADVVCFGSLAQRSKISRAAIQHFLKTVPDECLCIFDVNLRIDFFSAEILDASLKACHIVKLNDQEVPVVARLLGFTLDSEESFARWLLHKYALRLVCVTRGARGSLLVGPTVASVHQGYKVKVADTVGSGDAFTACLAHYFLRGASLDEINEHASRFAAWVATRPGATPSLEGRSLQDVLNEVETT